ncbi:prepilin-type N-terminal cleavage/methylation domain-containing protein [Candidatus Peregrinibacteria bacterium]|nr:prepilin-type N-terminal cleavage/methylation domain-containing protein [Candidatus Peregrinibacteria bacterium]
MKKTTKSAFHRGFTLIELMIVIVILGILMGTILPRLTGAQARARDTGRIADLNAIGQALETYFDDHGQYPGTNATVYCLRDYTTSPCANCTGEDGVDIIGNIASYLKGGVVPSPSESQQTRYDSTDTNICVGSYVYIPLSSRGIDNNGYALITDVETYQKANILADGLDGVDDTTDIGTELTTTTAQAIEDADALGADDTIYVVYN